MIRPLLTLLLVGCPKAPAPEPSAPPAVYAARIADAKTRPEPLTSVMRDVYDVRLLVQATPGAAGLALLLAPVGEDGAQDRCVPTTALPLVTPGADGAFQVDGLTLTIAADGFASTLVEASVAGRWQAGTLALDRVEGKIDTAPFVPRMGSGLGADAVCTLLPALGPCAPCAGSAGPTCWTVGVDALPLVASEAAVQARDRSAICADPACSGVAGCGAP